MTDSTPQILVVDDDRLVLATVVAGLRQAGFDIIETDNGDDAILLARKHKAWDPLHDLVFLVLSVSLAALAIGWNRHALGF